MNFLPPTSLTLGYELRRARFLRSLTSKATAQLAEIDPASLRSLEDDSGTVAPLLSVLEALNHRFVAQPNGIALGPWLRERRKSLRYSQAWVANKADLSKPTVVQIERGQGHIDSLSRVMAVLGLPFALRPCEVPVQALVPPSPQVHIHVGDCLEVLQTFPANTINACITSPPYFGQRDYGHEGQLGLEETPTQYIDAIMSVAKQVKRVLHDNGTFWLNIADTFARRAYKDINVKKSDLIGIPWRLVLALQADGWFVRQEIVWEKPNPMPESATNRLVRAHEFVFLLTKSPKYYFDSTAIREIGVTTQPGSPQRNTKSTHGSLSGGNTGIDAAKQRMREELETKGYVTRNKRSVWTISVGSKRNGHFAAYPEKLAEDCILAGCPEGGMVLDPFAGSGTTGAVAKRLGRNAVLIEINPAYAVIARKRCAL